MNNQIVELHFPVSATTLPSDHGYPIFGALCDRLPELHEADWIGIHSFKGTRSKAGQIRLLEFPCLKLRLPADRIPLALKLAGARLNVHGHHIALGLPSVSPLRPAPNLRSRLVILKTAAGGSHNNPSSSFLDAVERQLRELGVTAQPELETAKSKSDLDPYARRTLRIKGTILTGYGVILRGLSEADSITVQQCGIGGRRKFGCGIFVPVDSGDNLATNDDASVSQVL